VQALGGGSPELRPLEGTRDGRTAAVDDEPVRIPIEDALDLHAFAPRDVASVVADYLEAAHAKGFTEVRLIHGRGVGVQRRIVQSLLGRHPLVAAYADAPPERGGAGATLVRLRPRTS
jgi:DNA-nicking Smr family endonuclease